jgi:hypothetical protein
MGKDKNVNKKDAVTKRIRQIPCALPSPRARAVQGGASQVQYRVEDLAEPITEKLYD